MPAPLAYRLMRRWGSVSRSRGFVRAKGGSVTLEFVLAAPALLVLLGFLVDYGLLLRVRATLSAGMMSVVQYATAEGSNTSAATLSSIVEKATSLTGVTATASGPSCFCPSAYPVTLTAASCGTTCPNSGTTANSYVTVTGTYTYTPLLPGMSAMVATTVVETATAMVQ